MTLKVLTSEKLTSFKLAISAPTYEETGSCHSHSDRIPGQNQGKSEKLSQPRGIKGDIISKTAVYSMES